MKNQWYIFGNRARFSFEFCFRDDPDQGRSATALESASWGAFRLWVKGRNLCQYHHRNQVHEEIDWYLSPLFFWLAENWDPLFHEERFPLPCQTPHARMGYMDSMRRYLSDTDPAIEAKEEAWYGWWERHALRSCRQGGLFPDLFFRRLVDFSEISWGNSPLEGVEEDFYFTVPHGSACLPVEDVAEPFLQGLQHATTILENSLAKDGERMDLMAMVNNITSPNRLENRLSWYASRISRVTTQMHDWLNGMRNFEEGMGFIRRLSPAVAMFGSLSPQIGEADLESLFQAFIAAHENSGGDSERLKSLIPPNPDMPEKEPSDAGYDAALDLLALLYEDRLPDGWIDVEDICRQLGILIKESALHDSNIRGVAFAGEAVTPTILINIAHPNNQQDEGKRFTIGHELCHILHDRFFGGEIAMATGPWAPANVEKRANAFSAMLLMPLDLVNATIQSLPDSVESANGITRMAKLLRVSWRALLWHMYNLNKLDDRQRSQLERDLGLWGAIWSPA